MTTRIQIFAAGKQDAHIRKIARTTTGDVTEVDMIISSGDFYETHITTEHMLTVTERAPGGSVPSADAPLPDVPFDTTNLPPAPPAARGKYASGKSARPAAPEA